MTMKVIDELRRLLNSGDGDVDVALKVLRDAGYSKVQSTTALAEIGQYSLAQAKVLVHESRTWKDVRWRDSKFHDTLETAIEGSQSPTKEE